MNGRWAASSVVLLGTLVLVGWFGDVHFLKHIFPDEVSMKFTTALSFLLLGISLGVVKRKRDDRRDLIAVVAAMSTFAVCLTQLIASIVHQPSIFDTLLVSESQDEAVKSIYPGRPSICTVFNFMCLGFSSISWVFGKPTPLRVTGWMSMGTGVVVVVGYLVGSDVMKCFFDSTSTAVAIHTAFGLIVLGYSALRRSLAA